MGDTLVYGLPVPPLTGVLPDGPDGTQDLADRLELTLINDARTFVQTLTAGVTWSSGAKDYNLTSVPLNRPVMLAAHMTVAVNSYQYVVAEIREGATVISANTLGSSPWGFTGPLTVSTARSFTSTPVLRLLLGITSSATVSFVRLTGMGFGWEV